MCGIAALFSPSEITHSGKINFLSVLHRLRHRGFSLDEYAQAASCCLLGTNRLEIVDRDMGRQPFVSEDNKISIIFNGEIYNFRELRASLAEEGYFFKTNCDTEVLLAGYCQWGLNGLCLRIRGMYAFLIYDSRDVVLQGARDPFGIKPLYWTITEEGVFFGSEIKSLILLNSEIHELGPGETIRADKHFSPTSKRFFNSDTIKTDESISFNDSLPQVASLIEAAVKIRVQTDLPVALLLGGIDSAIILSQAVKYHKNITAFTVGNDDNAEDVIFARRLCNDLNVPLQVIYAEEEKILRQVPEVITCIESFEPNHIRGGAFSYLLAQHIHKAGFRIALCGEGADELFCGYSEYGYYLQHNGPNKIHSIRQQFVSELYKTQLKRVDRTAMAFTLEVRVPYLDLDVAQFIMSLPVPFFLKKEDGRIIEKLILRKAFSGQLPEYALTQKKRVLSFGAGFGTNAEEGPFYERASSMIGETEFSEIRSQHPEAHLHNKEEALYFKIMQNYYPIKLCPFLLERPFVNKIE